MSDSSALLYRRALWLSVCTILYNLIEGGVSVAFGVNDEALALLGFGIDSFIEVISGLGIFAMVLRIQRHGLDARGRFETRALQITAVSFFLLALGLTATTILSLVQGHRPEATLPGMVIGLLSILTMWGLSQAKIATGRALGSEAIVADGKCTRTCLAMSVVLLASSLLFEVTGWGGFDALGALGLVWYSVQEGREAWEKSRHPELHCGCGHDSCASSTDTSSS